MVEKFICKICQTDFHQDTATKAYVQCPVCFTFSVYPIALKELYQKLLDNPELNKQLKGVFGEEKKENEKEESTPPIKPESKDSNTKTKKKGHFEGFKWVADPDEESKK